MSVNASLSLAFRVLNIKSHAERSPAVTAADRGFAPIAPLTRQKPQTSSFASATLIEMRENKNVTEFENWITQKPKEGSPKT